MILSAYTHVASIPFSEVLCSSSKYPQAYSFPAMSGITKLILLAWKYNEYRLSFGFCHECW